MRVHAIAVLTVLLCTCAVAAQASVPEAPDTVRRARIDSDHVKITWVDNSDNETGFQVLRKGLADANFEDRGTVDANTTEFVDDAPTGTVFIYEVVAFNDDGTSADSNICYVNRPPPGVPLYFNIRLIALTVMRVSWSDRSNGEKGFEIQRAKFGKPFQTLVHVPANTTTYDDYTLDPANTYSYRVRALGRAGICWDNSRFTPTRTDTTKGDKEIVQVELFGHGKGTVTSKPAGIICGPKDDQCTAEFPLATDVVLTAKSTPLSHFAGWSEYANCQGQTAPCTVYTSKPRVVGATFRKNR
ncbi:MAG TPA: fibronectin type III domain-containing protein [Candidatus Binatia bacterium]|jgi:hypothetical protein